YTSGVYGNFGQANYGAAKMGVVGLMNTLCIEGMKNGIRVNCLAPTAATRMTEDIMTEEMLAALNPRHVTPAAIFLVSREAPNRTVMFAGGGTFSKLEIRESKGIFIAEDERDADRVAARFDEIGDMSASDHFTHGNEHIAKVLTNAQKATG
ncbi:MAG: SDR family NAD(P)-dependent oxidoreductase, partial [Nitratireductor sp.]|nr:SDR family NAD(P)-dependent oxidoreductase [Nitratireductor sp.]